LIAELQRRCVFRAMVGYGIGAFAVLQIVEPVMHGLHWPDALRGRSVDRCALLRLGCCDARGDEIQLIGTGSAASTSCGP